MAGILDSKQRIFDTIITDEGRRQMSRGALRIRFATFTDQDAFYEYDAISGSTDASARPHFEAFSRPQDTITFEADDVGNLIKAPGGNYDVIGGHIRISSGSNYLNFPSAATKKQETLSLLTASFDSFQQLYAISTNDPLDDVQDFVLSVNDIEFDITDDMLSEKQGIDVASIDDVESLFQDRRLSHAPNFQYMPPVNVPTPEHPEGSSLGRYPRIDQGEYLTYEDLLQELEDVKSKTVFFSDTSRDGNIFCQFFDVRENKVMKLDAIDFGEFIAKDGNSRHVFFMGRIFQDSRGSHTFVNIFTLVFS